MIQSLKVTFTELQMHLYCIDFKALIEWKETATLTQVEQTGEEALEGHMQYIHVQKAQFR